MDSVKVPTTTSIATISAVPPMAPLMLIKRVLAAAAPGSAAAPRSSPVTTWAVVPSSASRTASALAPKTP